MKRYSSIPRRSVAYIITPIRNTVLCRSFRHTASIEASSDVYRQYGRQLASGKWRHCPGLVNRGFMVTWPNTGRDRPITLGISSAFAFSHDAGITLAFTYDAGDFLWPGLPNKWITILIIILLTIIRSSVMAHVVLGVIKPMALKWCLIYTCCGHAV